MKKKIAALTCIMMITAAIGVFAAVQIKQDSLENMSKFDRMVKVMNETIEDDDEYDNLIINYMYLDEGYHLSTSQMDYIASLIIDGYNMSEVLECTYFWLDTNENITIVKEMCDIKDKDEKYDRVATWVEEIFNVITEDKCGVLSEEDIIEYRKNGVTDEEILTANKLCRKGVYTIQQILEKRQDGESFTAITKEIENGGKRMNVQSRTVSDLPELEKSGDVVVCRELEMLSGVDMETYVRQIADGKSAEELLNSKTDEVLGRVVNSIKEKNLFRRRNKKEKIIEEMDKKGLKNKKIDRLLESYDEMDILNASEISKNTGEDIEELLKKNKKGINWNKIAEENRK